MNLSLSLTTTDNITRFLTENGYSERDLKLTITPFNDPDELFRGLINGSLDFDIAEISLSSFLANSLISKKYVGLPIFTSRKFRHSDIFVRGDLRFDDRLELSGLKVLSFPNLFVTASVWQVGILTEIHGFDLGRVKWLSSQSERFPIKFRNKISLSVDPSLTLDSLRRGQVDVQFGPLKPQGIEEGEVRRLFPKAREEELMYFKRTGIFPPMHVIILKRSLVKDSKEITSFIYRAFAKSKEKFYQYIRTLHYYMGGIAWLDVLVNDFFTTMGRDPYSFGLERNRTALEKLVDYIELLADLDYKPKLDDLFYELEV